MSKIGRKPILFSSAKISVVGNTVVVQGPKDKIEHDLPLEVTAVIEGNQLLLKTTEKTREVNTLWGLHRALLANKIKGLEHGFERKVTIVGLGFKAIAAGKNLTFSLGYSHKIDYVLPDNVTVDIDKTGQNLVFKSADKFALGNVCDKVRSFRMPEPYKGTGIIREGDIVLRKAGKTKSA